MAHWRLAAAALRRGAEPSRGLIRAHPRNAIPFARTNCVAPSRLVSRDPGGTSRSRAEGRHATVIKDQLDSRRHVEGAQQKGTRRREPRQTMRPRH